MFYRTADRARVHSRKRSADIDGGARDRDAWEGVLYLGVWYLEKPTTGNAGMGQTQQTVSSRSSGETKPSQGGGGGGDVHALQLGRIKASIFEHYAGDSNSRLPLLKKAFEDAEFHHREQSRKSGEPFIMHPARVALMAAEAGLDVETAIIALLHDVIEDTEVTKEEMKDSYGDWLADVVDGLTKEQAPQKGSQGASVATYRKLISSTVRDLRTLEVKILDRLDNMRDLGFLRRNRQRQISMETMNVYVAMAQRLGMQNISDELTALAFRYMYPKRFKHILQDLKEFIQAEQPKARSIIGMLEKHLGGLKRTKVTIEPVYRQISDFIFDDKPLERALTGFRVRVPGPEDCYRALGALHMNCRVVANSIKDYISNPKPNRYQGLHSEIFIGRNRMQVVIVSSEMEQVNAHGILAKKQGSNEDLVKYYQSYLDLLDHYSGDNDDLRMEDVLRYAQMETLQVFTPKGDLLGFSQGATVLDMAFAIHTDLGMRCSGALVGGRKVGRFTELADGDVVKIITSGEVSPNHSWLENVTTTRAKLAVRRYLNAQANLRAQEVGRRMFAAELARLERSAEEMERRPEMKSALKKRKLSLARFYQHVGTQKISSRRFLEEHGLLTRKELSRLAETEEKSLLRRFIRPIRKEGAPLVTIKGTEEGFISLGNCCSPLPGDAIAGVRSGKGLVIHRAQCEAMEDVSPESFILVGWEADESSVEHRLSISLSKDRPGVLYKVSKVMRDLNVNIMDIGLKRIPGVALPDIRVHTESISPKVFRTVIARLRDIKEVSKIVQERT